MLPCHLDLISMRFRNGNGLFESPLSLLDCGLDGLGLSSHRQVLDSFASASISRRISSASGGFSRLICISALTQPCSIFLVTMAGRVGPH
ncbi:MAG: hypothetical protein Ct9H90mP16_19020 [Candidatus Poseidoniales archaeon]|nr:MAG: hypothetical protein Ct9H90mP16_19020 [Candidatus Poseidoniales archaeon]